MSDRIKKAAMGVALLAAFALGGAAVAGAVSGNSGGSNAQSATSTAQQVPPRMQNGRRSDESALSGSTAEQVRAAALARVSGGTILRIETDADGHAAYEAHMTRSDGSPVTVYVNKQFEVVSVEDGPPGR
jgi:Peptidase propeptide and YPEB domain